MDGTSPPFSTDDLARLFGTHAEGLAGAVRGVLGRRAELEEALQESFLRACRALEKGFAPRNPAGWIFVVTLNTAKDLRRRQKYRRPAVALEEVEAMRLSTSAPGPSQGLERSEAMDAARAAIHELRDPEKEVFLLRVSGGLPYDEIAASLGIPVGTAKTRMRLALQNLRATLKDFAPVFEGGKELP